jgi:hypothetical protein
MTTEHSVTLVCSDKGTEVHKHHCRDTEKAEEWGYSVWDADVRDVHDVVLETYGPNSGSFFAENGGTVLDWQDFNDVRLMPCVKALRIPFDLPEISIDDRVARYGDDRRDDWVVITGEDGLIVRPKVQRP